MRVSEYHYFIHSIIRCYHIYYTFGLACYVSYYSSHYQHHNMWKFSENRQIDDHFNLIFITNKAWDLINTPIKRFNGWVCDWSIYICSSQNPKMHREMWKWEIPIEIFSPYPVIIAHESLTASVKASCSSMNAFPLWSSKCFYLWHFILLALCKCQLLETHLCQTDKKWFSFYFTAVFKIGKNFKNASAQDWFEDQ